MVVQNIVIPAKAGIHFPTCQLGAIRRWIPAFSGMTVKGLDQ